MRLGVIDKSDVPESSHSDEDEPKSNSLVANHSGNVPYLNAEDVKVNKYSQQKEFKHQTWSSHCEEEQGGVLLLDEKRFKSRAVLCRQVR